MGAIDTRKLVFRLTLHNKPPTIPIRRSFTTKTRRLRAWIAAKTKSGLPPNKSGGMRWPRERFIPAPFGAPRAGEFRESQETELKRDRHAWQRHFTLQFWQAALSAYPARMMPLKTSRAPSSIV